MRTKLMELFNTMDCDNSGALSLDEIEELIDQPDSMAYLQSLGISVQDVWTLFKLLDDDGDGSVNCAEFIQGCMNLRCEAKAVHLAIFQYEQKKKMECLDDALSRVSHDVSILVKRGHSIGPSASGQASGGRAVRL